MWNVPYSRNPFFTGRAQTLSSLHTMLLANQSEPLAISGLGGIGKTQTAIEYAYCYHKKYCAVFWVQANSRETLIADSTKIATLLHLPEQNAREPENTIQAVKRWLESNSSWLLIFDNADDLPIVRDVLPAKNRGHILFTTRATATGEFANRVKIDKMDMQEGVLLLLRRAKILTRNAPLENAPEADLAIARTIAQAIDGLPLALDQAGAYIEETGCSLSNYRQLYQTHRAELLKERGERKDYHPDPVATTWALSFGKVQSANSAAADLLRLCAFLAPDDIPEELISNAPEDIGTELQSLVDNQHKLNLAIRELLKYSLIQRDRNRHTIVMHRLVQDVLRDEMNEETRQQWAKYTIRAVARSFPDVQNFEERSKCQHWIPHALVCAEFIEEWELVFEEAAALLNEAGYYLQDRAQYAEAEPLYKRALAIKEEMLGETHLNTALSLNNLGLLYIQQGKYAEAEPLYKRALAIKEEMLGETHPNTASSLNSLGDLYYEQGKYAEAEPLYKRALAITENVRGEMHPETATSLNSLGGLYYEQEKYTEAESLFKRALAITEEILGEAHPKTATSLNSLGGLYASQRKYTEAEPLLKRALVIAEHVLGETHSSTRLFRVNYAAFLRAMKHEDEARALEQRKESS